MQELNPVNLQSNILPPTVTVHMMEAASEFVVPGIVVPIALPRKKTDTVWFVEVVDINWICHEKENTLPDSYGHIIAPGFPHLSSLLLEKNNRYSLMKKSVYSRTKKVKKFFKESIMHPYLNMQQVKCGLGLSVEDYTDTLLFIETNKFSHLQVFLKERESSSFFYSIFYS